MRRIIHYMFAALLAFMATSGLASERENLAAVIAFNGEGRLFQVGADKLEWLGALSGIMYIETSEGEMDEAFVECSVQQQLNATSSASTATGKCMIIQGPEDAVFATLRCDGTVGACKGTMELTSGTGLFEGITGSGDIIIRSPLRHLADGLGSGADLGVDSAVAIIPDLDYQIPGGGR